MTIRNHPEPRQTLPGVSRAYRLYTVEDCDFEDFAGEYEAGLVVTDGWGTSRSHTVGEDGCVLNVYAVPVDLTGEQERHPLDKTRFEGTYEESSLAAKRAAFEAGILAYMVYVDPR